MKVLIVDDESPARDRLRRLLGEIDDCEFAGEAGNGNEALTACASLKPDVVLLDVHMPGLWGIEVAQHLSTFGDAPAVIFTTAYSGHAIDAFDAQAIGYLLKPIRKEKLARALIHASRNSARRIAQATRSGIIEHRREHVWARLGDQLRLIAIADVDYFFAGDKYVAVHHKNGQDLIDEPLKTLSREFADDFIRIHRNALVAERRIAAIERGADGHYSVHMRDSDVILQVSRRHATELMRRVKKASRLSVW
jgi:two-component system response regulator AlgR